MVLEPTPVTLATIRCQDCSCFAQGSTMALASKAAAGHQLLNPAHRMGATTTTVVVYA